MTNELGFQKGHRRFATRNLSDGYVTPVNALSQNLQSPQTVKCK